MENSLITERTINEVLKQVISEETSKVKRDDFARVQFKIEELQNSLSETMKEFRKLEDSIPNGLKTLSNGRISVIGNNLSNTQKLITQLKDKIKQYKKSSYSQQMDEKKKL
jgi:predicted  nucleic acid-binding Zn-ribbon protein